MCTQSEQKDYIKIETNNISFYIHNGCDLYKFRGILGKHEIQYQSGIEGDIYTNNQKINFEFISALEAILPSCAGNFKRSEKPQMDRITWRRYLPVSDFSSDEEDSSSRSEEVDMPSVIAYYKEHLRCE